MFHRPPHDRDRSTTSTRPHSHRGVREELAKVTLARKIVSVTLRLWRKGELWDPEKLTMQAT
jgi:hypothetical protein